MTEAPAVEHCLGKPLPCRQHLHGTDFSRAGGRFVAIQPDNATAFC
jgi:hypothetical protein